MALARTRKPQHMASSGHSLAPVELPVYWLRYWPENALEDLRLSPLLGCPEVPASERPPTVMYGRVSPGVGTHIDAAQGALRMAHWGPLMMINCIEKGAEVARILRRNSSNFYYHMTCQLFINSIAASSIK